MRSAATIRPRIAGLSHLAELEHECVDNVLLLDVGLADEELAGLAVVVGEAFGPQPPLGAGLVALAAGVGAKPAAGSSRGPGGSQEFGS